MLIYLAELSHTGRGPVPRVVPLATGYIAAATIKMFPEVKVRIFRDPQKLLTAARQNSPDIVGFSVYHWSERLAGFCAGKIKTEFPLVVTVAGGASIDDHDASLKSFLINNPQFDYGVLGQGENGFTNLVKKYLDGSLLEMKEPVGGCAFVDPDGRMVKGDYAIPDLSDLPSPYLDGLLDDFLILGYEPIIQTMRGCPYGCTYCVSGKRSWNKIRAFSLERSFAEMDYIRRLTRSDKLIVADENVGILGDRDVALAERIIAMHQEHGYPQRLYHYTSKIITSQVKKIAILLAPIGQFTMSFQTLDERVRKEIARKSVDWEMFVDYVDWAGRYNIASVTELIFGFPGESADGYISGMERLISTGVNRVYSYNLRLLSGTALATEESREKYGFVTLFRATEGGFGTYDGEIVSEAEEVVISSLSFGESDYFTVRKYGLFLELALGRGYLSDLINFLRKIGLSGEKIVRYLAEEQFDGQPNLRQVVLEYEKRVKEELFYRADDCEKHIRSLVSAGGEVPESKLNLIFTGKIVLNDRVRKELLEAVKLIILKWGTAANIQKIVTDYVDNIVEKRILCFKEDEANEVVTGTNVPVEYLPLKHTETNKVIQSKDIFTIKMQLPEDYKRHRKELKIGSDPDEASLQRIFMTVGRFGLLRHCELFD
ncbi:MAG: radical SAM protein [Proteobacteria bacterium]|nr:radical SAM protein [Pseudomonadota bacterium]MBU1741423.1 radical SAM protein [Pseudomonadota bacterium]